MTYLKQSDVKPKKVKTVAANVTAPPVAAPTKAYWESADVPGAIDRLASIVSTYVTQARDGDNGSGLYTTPGGHPVRVYLEGDDGCGPELNLFLYGDAVESIADSLKRIADAMAK
jgi:hypothetical protein